MLSPTADAVLECFTMREIAQVLHISERHAYRLAADPELNRSKDDLMRLEAADILLGSEQGGRG